MNKLILKITAIINLGAIAMVFCFYSCGESSRSTDNTATHADSTANYTDNTSIYKKLIAIERDTSLSKEQMLQQVNELKQQFDGGKLTEDSVYARILHRIGLLEYFTNKNLPTTNAIILTSAAIRINSAGKKYSSPALCARSYINLGTFYDALHIYEQAAKYYDSAIMYRKQFYVENNPVSLLLFTKGDMLFNIGDYQNAVEEFDRAMIQLGKERDSSLFISVLNGRARAYIKLARLDEALEDVTILSDSAKVFKDNNEQINAMFLKAEILALQKDFSRALSLYKEGISERLKTKENSRIAEAYLYVGYFYFRNLQDYTQAKDCYQNTVKYAGEARDIEALAKGHINLQQCSFKQNNYKEAERFCMEALKDLKMPVSNNFFVNPSSDHLSQVSYNEITLVILRNKVELLLKQFTVTNNKQYLTACLQTALLTDSLITITRHRQSGEQSKLYWRNRTREFFSHAIEACYLAGDSSLAFYFMEKSRAVLLNDKQNELGASAYLPMTEAMKEQALQAAFIKEQQQLASLKNNDSTYKTQQSKFLQAKTELEQYIQSLEKQYAAYYQYKYADKVPSLTELQHQLSDTGQSFIHYFISDTTAYVLGITHHYIQMIRLSKDNFDSLQISFLQQFSREPASINDYNSFITLSNLLYKRLFQPLHLPKGRIVICPDNILIPFEALCTDPVEKKFLIEDYIFSYAYSARYLLKPYHSYATRGDFIGFAPVSFKAYPNMADLKQSDDALKQSASRYKLSKLFTSNAATRQHFMSAAARYTIVNVFSHARADTSANEPVLYMHDSVIYLSELQMFHQPATKLVVLSACETGVGKSAKGEGILSLARGFASAGIPAVAATLWQADERSIYSISEKFHANLSQGMPKDEALQKAKLSFIQNEEHEKPHPYFWANMILVGSHEPVTLSENRHVLWWLGGIFLIVVMVMWITLSLKSRRHKRLK